MLSQVHQLHLQDFLVVCGPLSAPGGPPPPSATRRGVEGARDVFVEKWLTSLEDVGAPLAGVILQLSQPEPVAELRNNSRHCTLPS